MLLPCGIGDHIRRLPLTDQGVRRNAELRLNHLFGLGADFPPQFKAILQLFRCVPEFFLIEEDGMNKGDPPPMGLDPVCGLQKGCMAVGRVVECDDDIFIHIYFSSLLERLC